MLLLNKLPNLTFFFIAALFIYHRNEIMKGVAEAMNLLTKSILISTYRELFDVMRIAQHLRAATPEFEIDEEGSNIIFHSQSKLDDITEHPYDVREVLKNEKLLIVYKGTLNTNLAKILTTTFDAVNKLKLVSDIKISYIIIYKKKKPQHLPHESVNIADIREESKKLMDMHHKIIYSKNKKNCIELLAEATHKFHTFGILPSYLSILYEKK
jgi:hypothetical protein